ncbi:MAG: hypothetical protein ACI9DJ_001389 [Algoriphagus sp.]|jgi:hypothetical protein
MESNGFDLKYLYSEASIFGKVVMFIGLNISFVPAGNLNFWSNGPFFKTTTTVWSGILQKVYSNVQIIAALLSVGNPLQQFPRVGQRSNKVCSFMVNLQELAMKQSRLASA